MIIFQSFFGQQSFHSFIEKSGVQVDLFEHAQKVPQSGTKRIKSAKNVFFTEWKFPDFFADFSIFDSSVSVFVILIL